MKNSLYMFTTLFWLAMFTVSCQDAKSSLVNSELKGMVHIYGKKKYNSFSGTWRFKDEATWLLLKNGWALKNPEVPISEMDLDKLREDVPERWVEWKDNEIFKDKKILSPSPKATRYDLSVVLYSVGGNPVTTSVTKKRFTMSSDGKFMTNVLTLQDAITTGSVLDKSDSFSGTYNIDGHSITLTLDDGGSASFIFATDGKSEMILGRDFYFNME